MTKYSTELKIEIVSKYLNHEDSIKGLAKQYNIHWTLIRRWIDKAKCQGLAALSVKHTKTTYSSDFRLNVVRYYLTHSIGVSKVAAKFNISDSQVYNWAKKFNEEGYAGLLPKQKGRPRKVPKKSKKTTKKLELITMNPKIIIKIILVALIIANQTLAPTPTEILVSGLININNH